MDVDNREVIKKLTEYFLKQDKKLLAECLAGFMIDVNRFHNYLQLDDKERNNFDIRIGLMAEELTKFVKNGPSGDLKVTVMNSDGT